MKSLEGNFIRAYWLIALLALIGIGWVAGSNATIAIPNFIITTLLAIGLYAAATGINPAEARKDWKLIGYAISIGVVAKALIAGALCYLLTRNAATSIVAGVVFSQIDPLSVSAMQSSSQMSSRAKHIIHAWASFDDPVSVLLARYIVPLALGMFGISNALGISAGLGTWLLQLLLNLLFAYLAYAAWRVLHKQSNHQILERVLLVVSLVAAISFGLVLGIAIIGLFLRPVLDKVVERIVQIAYGLAAIFIGTLLAPGINLSAGILLGMAAYATHYIVSEVLTRMQRLSKHDRLHLGLGQQSGITACNLILLFAPSIGGLAAICAPALVTVNVLHLVANTLLDRREAS